MKRTRFLLVALTLMISTTVAADTPVLQVTKNGARYRAGPGSQYKVRGNFKLGQELKKILSTVTGSS